MGSFANSLHIRCPDAQRVVEAIRTVLAQQRWQPTEKALSKAACTDPDARARELHVSAPAAGWVSVLDSDLGSLEQLTRDLAAKLHTHTLLCFVDDSDSWSFQLAQPSGEVSVFDSAGLFEEEEGDAGDAAGSGNGGNMAQATAAIQKLQALMQDGSIQQRMQEIQAQMSAAAPPDIRAAEARIRNRQATPADIQTYQAWAMREMPKYMADLKALLGGALPQATLAAKPTPQPASAEPVLPPDVMEALRPLLAADVTDDEVQAVLGKRAVFAEETLAEFLPLIGLPAFYSSLSYDYLDEAPPEELAAQGIHFVGRLCFEKQASRRKR